MNAPLRLPLDEIAEQHRAIHAELESWGRWNREGRPRVYCGSAESKYRAPLREPQPRWELPPDPRLLELDRAVRFQPELWRKVLASYYVHNTPVYILIRKLKIHFTHFGPIIFKARAGVLNRLRANPAPQHCGTDAAR